AAARTLIEVVRMSVYVPRNARALLNGLRLGDITPLSAGEVAARDAGYKPYSLETRRAWKYWAHKAGCAHLVEDHPIDHQHKPWGAAGCRCGFVGGARRSVPTADSRVGTARSAPLPTLRVGIIRSTINAFDGEHEDVDDESGEHEPGQAHHRDHGLRPLPGFPHRRGAGRRH